MKRFLMLVAVAVAATLPAVILRFGGWRLSPFVDVAAFGIAILAAGFLLSWGAETAEQYVSQGLILAAVALVTVLPEYAVDIYYAYMAGASGPDSRYAQYAAANMTGANRLLVGLAWPLMVGLHWMKDRHRSIGLAPGNAVEVGFLLVASLYAFVIVLKRAISLVDFVVLLAIFGTYVWRVRSMQKSDNPEEAEEPGPAAALDTLSPGLQWAAMAGLVATASGVILVSAEPFAEAMVNTGRAIGLNEFLLIQWLAPLASEAPAITVAVLFVRANRAGDGLIAMISDKINQWTLLVGMLPLALSIGAGATSPLPLGTRQGEEFFLTAAQSLLGIALLLRLRFGLVSALALAGLFAVQVGLAFVYRNDEARTITTLTWLAWTYLGLAGLLFLINRRRLVALLRSAITGDVSDVEPSEDRDDPAPRRGGREASSLVG